MLRLLVSIILVLAWTDCGAQMRRLTVPRDHYLGISPPCESVAEAKEKALRDVICQVLRTMGAEYNLRFDSHITMDSDRISRNLEEKFIYKASGLISELEQHIVSASYHRFKHGVVYEMLVHFPERLIKKMQRLSRGAKVIAKKVDHDTIELTEVNGVAVMLTEAEIVVTKRHKNAPFLNYYVMKVSDGSTNTYRRAFKKPVALKKGIVWHVSHPVSGKRNKRSLVNFILGTERTESAVFIGVDEVGRPVRVPVPF